MAQITDMQSILSQIQSLQSSGLKSEIPANVERYMNSVFTVGEDITNICSTNGEQKGQAISNAIQNIMKILISLGTKEEQKAKQEVQKTEYKTKEISINVENISEDAKTKIKAIEDSINAEIKNIDVCINEINKLIEENKIEQEQEKLKEQTKIIKENLEILKDDNKSPKEKSAAIDALRAAQGTITEIITNITNIQTEIATEIEKNINTVSTSIQTIEGKFSELNTVTKEYAKKQAGEAQKAQQATTEATTSTVTGTVNEATSAAAATAAASARATSAIPVFGSVNTAVATKLENVSTDQGQAGETRIGESAKNIGNNVKNIQNIGAENSELSGYVQSVVGASKTVLDQVTAFSNQTTALIKAVGSYELDDITKGNEELKTLLDNYKPVKSNEDKEVGSQAQGDKNGGDGKANDNSKQPQTIYDTSNTDSKNIDEILKKFELKPVFGV